jgi:hypothetical protein
MSGSDPFKDGTLVRAICGRLALEIMQKNGLSNHRWNLAYGIQRIFRAFL